MDRVRLVEACALLAMLHTSDKRPNVVSCSGSLADALALDVLRWPDVATVYVPSATLIKDRRIVVGMPPVASCQVVICSPNDDPSPYLHAVAPLGIVSASTALLDHVKGLYLGMRRLFRSVTPWREWMPEPLYGVLASPGGGKIVRQRHPPSGAKRLSSQYLPCLFTFGKDELPYVLPPQVINAQHPRPPADPPIDGGTPEFSPG